MSSTGQAMSALGQARLTPHLAAARPAAVPVHSRPPLHRPAPSCSAATRSATDLASVPAAAALQAPTDAAPADSIGVQVGVSQADDATRLASLKQAAAKTAADAAAEHAAPSTASLQPAVALCLSRTLPPQTSVAAAVQQLRAAVLEVPGQAGAYASGLIRFEVPLPLGSTALRWLRGQPESAAEVPSAAASSLLHPRIYFSPRRTTAADTEGSAAAGAASAGAGAVAGAGAAWLWRGEPGQALGEGVVADMQRFLSSAAAWPRIRAFGGARFNSQQQPADEWREFGSYCFLIPRLEYLEASGCCILACTVAWDACHSPAHASSSSSSSSSSSRNNAAIGFASAEAAVLHAVAALDALQPAAAPAAGALKLQRLGARHLPLEPGWHQLMGTIHGELSAAAAAEAEAEAEAALAAQLEGGGGGAGSLDAGEPTLRICPKAAREEYLLHGQEGLDELLAAVEGGFEATTSPEDGGLMKVVLARRTDVSIRGRVDPLALLEALQERDPRAYQLLLQMPSGASFLGSTPECLYTRTGSAVASEAVAGTRARGAGGDVEKDFWLAFDLLRSHKDHVEFTVVRDWVRQALGGVCESVQVDVAKSVLKQGAVQHLYGKLSAQLKPGCSDAHLLAALHPTPAVCGRPGEAAMDLLAASEPFDRGYYAGPFGWISHAAAEFVVAIRSALVQPAAAPAAAAEGALQQQQQQQEQQQERAGNGVDAAVAGPQSLAAGEAIDPAGSGAAAPASVPATAELGSAPGTLVTLFAGVGIVRGSESAQEWAELDLKVRQYERLLQGVPPLAAAPNVNALWARLLVEELCRLGCNTFCVAPGSRSSPLTVAVAQHPRARIVPCIDERSLGFWGLGHGRATGRPAVVITSSGTAVANLLPAAVEASQSGVPLLLVTGDRPAELRDTGANQTIDQVKLFGGYARWHADLPAPLDAMPARLVLSTVDAAVQQATGAFPGPVHINCQFREPLAPVEAGDWDRSCLQGLRRWEAGNAPFTAVAGLQAPPPAVPPAVALAGSAALGGLALDPQALSALRAICGARRGLIVAAELSQPEDVVAAAQLSELLGWPVAADLLSGLRAGVPSSGARSCSGAAVIHHFDHLLLLDRQQWEQLRPDVVLQLGGHITSKRVTQFLEWCCTSSAGSGDGSRQSALDDTQQQQQQQQQLTWIMAASSPKRHDQLHLLSHRLQAPLPMLAAALAAQLAADGATLSSGRTQPAARQQQRQQQQLQQQRYSVLLQLLDAEASAAVDAALAAMPELSEPQVARTLSQLLPPGEGLFAGNSMPIRDLDMYACPAPALPDRGHSGSGNDAAQAAPQQQGVVGVALGAPVAANRGASGIDGVLSTAAGFADGLGRGTTLVVGDISFLHDINGLNLLRSGEARPPLTVVLVNNGGGGIFSFLPIADSLPEDIFTPLWATPQHVDLEGMCRAHGIPHQKVSALEDLRTALHSAWGCNRHSVIEVITSRSGNVDRHREIQAQVKEAVAAALHAVQRQDSAAAAAPATAGVPYEVAVRCASYHAYSLPLAQPLTTTAPGQGGEQRQQHRQGFLLHVVLEGSSGTGLAHGVGEVAPLPGLHTETLQQAEQQLALLCQLLAGTSGGSRHGSTAAGSAHSPSSTGLSVPLTVSLLGGRMSLWLRDRLGVAPESLLPSVRCGLEAALLSALAQHQGLSLAQLLAGSVALTAGQPPGQQPGPAVALNGLLDCQGSPAEAAAEAAQLLNKHPYSTLKIKVGRRADPAQDAAAVLAIRQAVGPAVILRADANRRWTLEQAVVFGKAVVGAGLQYVEEPVACTADLDELYRRTGLHVALDESVDEGLVGPGAEAPEHLYDGVAALVLKPAVLGGFERAAELAAWAGQRGMLAVVSSCFESSLGIAQLGQLAAALDTPAPAASSSELAGTAHGLATLSWLAEDLLPAAGQEMQGPDGSTGSSMSMSMAACDAAVSAAVMLALGLDKQQHQQQQQQQQQQQLNGAAGASHSVPQPRFNGGLMRRRSSVAAAGGSYDFSLLEAAPGRAVNGSEQPPMLLLHGFMGGADDWAPLVPALGLQRRCLAIDLPGHGSTLFESGSSNGASSNGSASSNGTASRNSSSNGGAVKAAANEAEHLAGHSLEAMAEAVAALVEREGLQGCLLAGYSLGGRLALLLAARWPHLFSAVACISGSPGLQDPAARVERALRDDTLAAALRQGELGSFLSNWYLQPMWAQLRASPRYPVMLQQRHSSSDARGLAAVLAAASPGRAPSLWQELPAAAASGTLPPLLLVAGQSDAKFVGVAEKLTAQLVAAGGSVDVRLAPACGHAVHIERPLELLTALQQFSDAVPATHRLQGASTGALLGQN